MTQPVVRVGIIGGTGLYKLDGLELVATHDFDTPWGRPSAPLTVMRTPSGEHVAFLARHGTQHEISPSSVPARANIAALKHLGVQAILAFSATGSLQEEIRPRDFVVVSQIFDRTKGIRPSTFFGDGFVAHAPFGEPFEPKIAKLLAEHKDAMQGDFQGEPSKLHTKTKEDLTVVCMEGPAFSTRAESRFYQSIGGSVINMSVLPEAKLAREAEIAYQMVCMSTDYDAWREEAASVTVDEVMSHMRANGANAQRLAAAVIDPLAKLAAAGEFDGLQNIMNFTVTAPGGQDATLKRQLQFLHPNHWK